MQQKKKIKNTMSKSPPKSKKLLKSKKVQNAQVKNQNEEVIFSEESDSEYRLLNYPADDVYKNALKDFEISTQDKRDAGTSSRKSNESLKYYIDKCAKCNFKFTPNSSSLECFQCKKWYCLICAEKKRKDLNEIKKLKISWYCSFCKSLDKDNNNNIKKTKELEDENNQLREIIYQLTTENEKFKEKNQNLENSNLLKRFK